MTTPLTGLRREVSAADEAYRDRRRKELRAAIRSVRSTDHQLRASVAREIADYLEQDLGLAGPAEDVRRRFGDRRAKP